MINKYGFIFCRKLISTIIIFLSFITNANPQDNFINNINEKVFSEIYFTNYNTENHYIKAYLDIQSQKVTLSVNKKTKYKT